MRQRKGERTYWLLPGGGIRRGELLEAAVVRELQEECGIAVRVGQPLALVESISPDGGHTKHVVHVVYAAACAEPKRIVRSGQGKQRGDPAILETAWFSPAEVPELVIHPPVADLILTWLGAFPDGEAPGDHRFVVTGPRWVD